MKTLFLCNEPNGFFLQKLQANMLIIGKAYEAIDQFLILFGNAMENGLPIHCFNLSVYIQIINFSIFDSDFTIFLQQDSMFLILIWFLWSNITYRQ